MILTNQLAMTFDHEAIARSFVILEARREDGDYRRSLVPDLALQVGHALSVVYEWGNRCFILYARQGADRDRLKAALESEADDVCLREISSAALAEESPSWLAQLLCNALPALGANGRMYHNLTGRLYYRDPAWRRGRGEVPRCFWVLRLQLTWDRCVRLSVETFHRADCKRAVPGEAQYLLDSQSGTLRRLLRQDPDHTTPRFAIGSLDPSHHNTVPFLDFGSLEAFRSCRVGVLQRFLEDVRSLLAPCLTVQLQSLPEEVRLGGRALDPNLQGIRARLREVPLYLEDTVQSAASASLARALRRELEQYSGILLREGKPAPGDGLFRLVHNKEHYADHPERDPHGQAPRHCAVQHLTVEDFQLDHTAPKEDAPLRKVLQEMAVKLDILDGRITCYDWAALGYTAPVSFVTMSANSRDKRPVYRRLQVFPDGTLQFCQWPGQLLWEDPEKEAIAAAFSKKNGKPDLDVEGLVYEDPGDIQIIRTTNRFTLPRLDKLHDLLFATRDGDWLDVAPLLSVVQSLLPDAPDKDRLNLEILCSELAELGQQASRRQLRRCLRLQTALGRRVNEELYSRTGVRIGSGIKQKERLEELMGGTLGIRQFAQGHSQYYYGGRLPQSLQHSLPHACRIRRVSATGGDPHFERYLPLLEVEFVRTGAWPVLPFPFKYLREWNPD